MGCGCGGSSTPAPDPAIGEAQQRMAGLAERQQTWYESNIAPKVLDQLDQSLAISREQSDRQGELQDYALDTSKKYDQRYWGTQIPLEDQLIGQARAYNSDAEQARMAGQAGADVEQAGAAGRATLTRGLRGMGVNQGSAAAISAMSDQQMQTSLAKAGAINKTREAARQIGWDKMNQAAALGRGLTAASSSSSNTSIAAGQASMGAANSGLGAVGTASQINGQNTGSLGSLYNTYGNLGVGVYNAQLGASSGSQAGMMQGIGGLAQGVGYAFSKSNTASSSRRLKRNKHSIRDGDSAELLARAGRLSTPHGPLLAELVEQIDRLEHRLQDAP